MDTPRTVAADPFYRGFGMHWISNQDFIYISTRFYSHWKNVIRGKDVQAVDPNGNSRQFTVSLRNGRAAFTNGLHQFAEFYSLKDKALVYFKYVEPLTFEIRIFSYEGGPEIQYPEVINLSSDSDDDDDFDDPNDWVKVVNDKMARGRSPLHLPARVAKTILLEGMSTINVKVLNTNHAADCEISQTSRTKNEAYLCMGWYGLCKELDLASGNKLFFTFFPTQLRLVMSHSQPQLA